MSLWGAISGIGKAALGFIPGGNIIQGALGIGSELYGGYKAQQAQNQNYDAQNQRFNQISGLAQGQMTGSGPTGYEQMMNGFLQNQQAPGQYNAQQVSAGQAPSMYQDRGFNAGQDSLMQMLNRDPTQQLGSAGGYLNDLAQNGGKQDLTQLLSAMGAQQNANLQDQMAQQRAGVSGLGQLSGTAASFGAARLRNRAMIDNNTLNAQVQTQEMNNVNNRRLQAAGQLGQLNLQGVQNQMSAAGQLGNFANMAGQMQLQGNQQMLSAGMANQSAGLQANQQNNAAQSAYQQMMQQGLVSGSNMQNQNRQQNAQLLGLMAGQNTPQQSTQSPFAQSVQNASIMPALYGALNRKPASGTLIPTQSYQMR